VNALKPRRNQAQPMSLPVFACLTLIASAAVAGLILYVLA
jgi:hypothetical protein